MREKRQQEAVEAYMNSRDGRTIINACPRFGKIKVALDIVEKTGDTHILIIAPRNDIFDGWKKDIVKFGMEDLIVEYCTFTSLKKLKSPAPWGMVIIDEPHELSQQQQKFLKPIVEMFPTLGLTGTMTQKTRNELYDNLNLDVCYKYSIAQGVEEGILADYNIHIHKVPLDDKRFIYKTKSKSYTEQGYFNLYEYLRKETTGSNKYFMDLKLIKIIQDSISKMEYTRKLISDYNDERLLVFCGTTEISDKLGIPVYHSKNKEKEIFDDFCGGKIPHLATIKMMQAGITITPINKGILNYMSGSPEDSAQKICRFLGMEYGNPDKKAEIHIISSEEEFELNRLKSGLNFFDKEKIK